ncbi:hypothetical protein JOB18_036823 [Solea senegalensis]|uniref:Cell surface glycoprotein CD200 receptor 1-B-like n=2 Tax=Solea senegalensis TaxID=28829 RepID=A0AAV6RF52_SOLSE|nr:cell surface glycoprotein CD200 receptor 1-B-like [Solea senegalensis]KAG7503349.1 hypothetical protein JOB18_036823 [Solea senegalensis]
MEDFYGHFSNKRTLSLICCMFWISSHADADVKTISAEVGTNVTLDCNVPNGTLNQLTWSKDGDHLISYNLERKLYISEAAKSLEINLSPSENHLYTLVIDSAHKNHTGNYTCDITLFEGVWDQKWELIIKSPREHNESGHWKQILIPVATAVPIASLLIFTFSFILVQRIYNQHSEQRRQPPMTGMWQEETGEHIYENSLEINVSQPSSYHYKPRGH